MTVGSRLRVLLVEPYYGGSHRDWADGYVRHSRHDVRLVTHEAQFWKWRMRGGALTLAELIDEEVVAGGRPDVVIVSDMVDLPTLRWLTRDSLGDAPVLFYLHENQLTHPLGPRQKPDEGIELRNWVSMVAADLVVVNTASHRDALAGALRHLLGRAADRSHLHRLDDVLSGIELLPIGIDLGPIRTRREPIDHSVGPTVLWNQRWDPEKQPDVVLRTLGGLAAEDVAFRLVVVGENVRIDPTEFTDARRDLDGRIELLGYLEDRGDYLDQLGRADVVISAATHETFGISIVEAAVAGAVPVLPDRLSYPEVIPERFHPACLYDDGNDDGGGLRRSVRSVLTDIEAARSSTDGLAHELRRFDWSLVAPAYDDRLERLAAEGS